MTLTPFWGAAYYTDVGEAKRQAVNEWIRTSKASDAVIDFDKATRDPSEPKNSSRPTIPAITCTPVTQVTRLWPTRLTSDCSDRLTRRNQRRPAQDGEGRARFWLSRRTPVAGF